MDENLPYIGNPNLERQAAKARELAALRQAETLPDPRTYGFVKGLLGTAPNELGMSVLSPNTAPAKEAAYYGYQLGNAAQMLPAVEVVAGTLENVQKATALRKAQEANTFSLDRPGVSLEYGFGRRMGYPQEKGTEPSKLFSNFADNIKTEAGQDEFRDKMLQRAKNLHSASARGVKETTDFNLAGFKAVLDTYPDTGATRVILKDGNKIIAAANLDKGMIDSIAVSKEYSGKGLGKELLNFIDEAKIGNIYEVPDRSPGFVKIQKELIKAKQPPEVTISPSYSDPFGFSIK